MSVLFQVLGVLMYIFPNYVARCLRREWGSKSGQGGVMKAVDHAVTQVSHVTSSMT